MRSDSDCGAEWLLADFSETSLKPPSQLWLFLRFETIIETLTLMQFLAESYSKDRRVENDHNSLQIDRWFGVLHFVLF